MYINKMRVDHLIIYLYCLFLTLPIMSFIFPTVISMCLYVFVGFIVLVQFSKINKDDLLILLCALVIIGIPQLIRQGITVKTLYQIYYNMLPLMLGIYLLKHEDKAFCKRILYLLLLGALVTAITTSYALIKNPYISRFLATGNMKIYELSKWGNIGGFEFIYSIVLLLVCYVTLFKRKQVPFLLFLGGYIAGIYCIVLSQYTLALLLCILSVVLLLFSTSKFELKKCMIVCVISLIVILQRKILSIILTWIIILSKSEIVTTRLQYILDFLNNVNNQSDVSLRIDAYEKSWDAFGNNLFSLDFYSNMSEIGGHSTILDTMGLMGIIGLILIIGYYLLCWKRFYKFKTIKEDKGYFLFLFISVICLQIFNPFSITNYVFCIVMPLIALQMSKQD